jgi:hypothetical protein
MSTSGVAMAAKRDTTVKINAEMWKQLKLISAVTGEKMNDFVARVLAPILVREHKKALDQLSKENKGEE